MLVLLVFSLHNKNDARLKALGFEKINNFSLTLLNTAWKSKRIIKKRCFKRGKMAPKTSLGLQKQLRWN